MSNTAIPLPPMQINSFEQNAAALETYLAIKVFAKTPAAKVAAAEVAVQVASVFQDVANGAVQSINTEIASLISGISDPGLKTVATNLAALSQPYLQAEIAVIKGMPGVGLALDSGLTAAAAGINQVAQAYIDAAAAAKNAASSADPAQKPAG